MFENINDIRLLTLIYQGGNLTKAAQSLRMTPGMVSKRLSQLESKLGLRLFHRTTRSVQPTEEGRRLFIQATAILEMIESYESEWSGITKPQGLLKVTASSSFGRMYLMPLVTDFLSLYPEVEIKMDMSDRMIDIIDEGFDVAVRISQLNDSNLIARKIGNGSRLLCASKKYLAGRPPLKKPADLAKHNCIVLNGKLSWEFEAEGKITSQRISGNFQCNYAGAIAHCIREGLGVGIASYWHVKEDLEKGRMQIVLPEYKLADNPSVFAVYPSRKYVPLRTKVFIEYLEKNLKVPEPPSLKTKAR